MDAPTHRAIARFTAGYPALAEFLRASDEEIARFAIVPDDTDHDNILGDGDADEKFWHSFKIGPDGVWQEGAVDEAVSALGWAARNYARELRFQDARECILKAAHYLTDAGTIFHTARLGSIHRDGEEALNLHIDRVLKTLPLDPMPLANPRSLRRSTKAFCLETWRLFLPQVQDIKNGKALAKMPELAQAMLSRCAQFTLAGQLLMLERIKRASGVDRS